MWAYQLGLLALSISLTGCQSNTPQDSPEAKALKASLNSRTINWDWQNGNGEQLVFNVIDLRDREGNIQNLATLVRQGDKEKNDITLTDEASPLTDIVRQMAEARICPNGVESATRSRQRSSTFGIPRKGSRSVLVQCS